MASTSAINSATSATGMFTAGAAGGSELGKEDFLKLLVTQFQYQDPLNPMEDKEFISQLAQFSALEQQMTMNQNMEKMVEVQQQQQMISAATYIGREVSARGYGISISDKGQTMSTLQYALGSESSTTYVNIFDANNQLVKTVDLGKKAAGTHTFGADEWDGTDSNGTKLPDGIYTFSLVAKDADGTPIETDTSVTGIVRGVTVYDGDQILTFEDGRMVKLANVREVLEKKTTPPEDNDDGNDDGDGNGDGGDPGPTEGTEDTEGPDDAGGTEGTESAEGTEGTEGTQSA